MVLGDFNEMCNREKRIGLHAKTREINIDMFNNVINDVVLREIQGIGGRTTRTNRVIGDGG